MSADHARAGGAGGCSPADRAHGSLSDDCDGCGAALYNLRSGSTRSASRRRTRRRLPAPIARTAMGARSGLVTSTRLLVAHVTRTRRTVVQGANHRRHRRRTVLPSPLSSRPLARLRAPFAGLAVTSSHPSRVMPGVRHGATRGTASSISQMIRMPRRTWPGGRMPGVAAGSQRSKRAGRRTFRGCTARRTQI